jgi:hypothetical protein
MSTSSIVSAARTTSSGTVSRWRIPVMDVHRRDHVDPGGQQRLHVLPALGVTSGRARVAGVGVSQLVDQGDLRPPGQHRGQIQLADQQATVVDLPPRHHLETGHGGLGLGPAVRLDEGHDHVGAPLGPPQALGEHRVRLADPRCGTEVDPQRAAFHGLSLHRSPQALHRLPGVHQRSPCSSRLSSTTFTRG